MFRRVVLFVCVSAVLPTTCAWAQGEDHWENYQLRTLQSIVEMHRDDIENLNSKKKAVLLTGDSFQSQVELVYLGESRPLPARKGVLLGFWRKMLKEEAPPPDVFSTEFLFREGNEERWIAVQTPLVDVLPKEVRKGQSVNAYVIWIGAIKDGKHWEWMFAMNGFVAQ